MDEHKDITVTTVEADDMDGLHVVHITPGEGFECMTCGADDYGDGYTLTPDGAQQWHDDMSKEI